MTPSEYLAWAAEFDALADDIAAYQSARTDAVVAAVLLLVQKLREAAQVPPAEGVHAYFDALAALPGTAAYSLRDQAQLDQYKVGKSVPSSIVYDPTVDAARATIEADRKNLYNQVRPPIPDCRSEPLTIVWDAWWSANFHYSIAGIDNYKAFQFATPGDTIWTEVNARFALAKNTPNICYTSIRWYNAATAGPNVTRGPKGPTTGFSYGSDTLGPLAGEFAVAPETWTRYWVRFVPDRTPWIDGLTPWADGVTGFALSMWVADENHDAVQIYRDLLVRPNWILKGSFYWSKFWFEFNTSSGTIPPERGPLHVLLRNLAMVKSDNVPLERPVGRAA